MTNWDKDIKILNNIGVATFSYVPKSIIDYLQFCIDNRKNLENRQNYLAGHIKEEYGTTPSNEFNNFIVNSIENNDICRTHANKIDVLKKNLPFYCESLWFNFQKKHEFNPVHFHEGVFSFVIFMQIPYNLNDEDLVFPDVNKKNNSLSSTSRLAFLSTNRMGTIEKTLCNVDESYLHKMVVFPAKLLHLVYPFYTSDKERITVSGNIKLLVN